jgi:glucokinase-like ROK family protein
LGGGDRRTRTARDRNRTRVIGQLRAWGVTTQADIAQQTGLSRATVSSIVAELRADGVVREVEAETERVGGGRPPVLLRLDASAGLAVGVDLGHSHVRTAVATLAHEVLAEACCEMDVDHEAEGPLETAARMVSEVLGQARVDSVKVIGVGLGLPGPVDRARGVVGSRSILPGWVGVHAADELEARIGLRVEVDNDANLGALAEARWGAARGCTEVVYIKISTGIGAGFILEGRPYRGATGTAGEIGHTSVDPAGRFCYCGNRGCLETVAAGPAVVEALRRGNQQPTLAEILAEAAAGDNASRRAIAEAGRHVGVAVANLCNLLNPQRVVVGGQLSQAGDVLLDPLRESIDRYAVQAAAENVEVVPAAFGVRAEVMGALALALLESERPLARPLVASSQGGARD